MVPAGRDPGHRCRLLLPVDHGREPVTVEVPGTRHDLLTAGTVTDGVTLGRYGVAVLQP
ncbi:hypothetical protein C3488_14215 [Streptomyces sp. Ru72]|nr:hypothetical protein C3488_14215 [Streptomyces sp. Ru72]